MKRAADPEGPHSAMRASSRRFGGSLGADWAAEITSLPRPDNSRAVQRIALLPLSSCRNVRLRVLSTMCTSSAPGRAQFTATARLDKVILSKRFEVFQGGIAPIENHESPCARKRSGYCSIGNGPTSSLPS